MVKVDQALKAQFPNQIKPGKSLGSKIASKLKNAAKKAAIIFGVIIAVPVGFTLGYCIFVAINGIIAPISLPIASLVSKVKKDTKPLDAIALPDKILENREKNSAIINFIAQFFTIGMMPIYVEPKNLSAVDSTLTGIIIGKICNKWPEDKIKKMARELIENKDPSAKPQVDSKKS